MRHGVIISNQQSNFCHVFGYNGIEVGVEVKEMCVKNLPHILGLPQYAHMYIYVFKHLKKRN